MDFSVSEDHQLLRDTVRDFAENEIRPLARELDAREEFSVELTQKLGALGLFGMTVPESCGGQGLDYLAYAIAIEELARVDGSQAATVAAHNSLGVNPLYYFGSDAQREKYIPDLCTGEQLWGFGLTEPDAGSDSRGTKTTAKRDGDEWVINGAKIFITNASTPITAGVTVQASCGEKNGKPVLTCFLIPAKTPGFTAKTMHGKLMWRASNTAELYFHDCRIPDSQRLGEVGAGAHQMLQTLDSGRIAIAAMGVGCAQGAYELALAYAKEREQFGKPIAKFQAISFKLSDMAMKIELARTLLYKVCWLRDTDQPFGKESAMAKLYASEIAKEVADEAVQIHGGYGLMQEYDVERFYRDQRLLQIGEGTSEIQRLVIARHIGC